MRLSMVLLFRDMFRNISRCSEITDDLLSILNLRIVSVYSTDFKDYFVTLFSFVLPLGQELVE